METWKHHLNRLSLDITGNSKPFDLQRYFGLLKFSPALFPK